MYQYKKDYPRPQMVRGTWTDLNGTWDFAFDDEAKGEAAGYYEQFPAGKTILVPFTYETAKSTVGDETVHRKVWYQRSFSLDHEIQAEKEWMLYFEGSDYHTKVWVNGQCAGEHSGAYARFGFAVSSLLHKGENKITVLVEDNQTEKNPRGKQRWVGYNFGCWYVQTTGIWKTVWMEEVAKTHIDSLKLTPNLKTNNLEIEALVAGDVSGYGAQPEYRLEVSASFRGTYVGRVSVDITRDRTCAELNMYNKNVQEFGMRTWRPEDPALYDLDIILWKGEEAVDSVQSYVGMRDVTVQGQNVLLNGCSLYQRLILDQGYWEESHLTPPSEEALVEDIDKILQLGFNGVRKHQKVEDERFLFWCDVKGLLVWSEMAATYVFEDDAVESFTKEWMEIVRQNYNHPCIITWTPFNESWGVPQIKTNQKQQHFTEAVYYLTKAFDSMRPVITNDGWEHTVSDLVTLHDYASTGAELTSYYSERLPEVLQNKVELNHNHRPMAEGYTYKGQPLIITEYGGIAMKNESGWGYGEQEADEEALLRRYEDVTTAIQNMPHICGFCYTQVSDVQQEVNGLMDAGRNFKVNPEKIHEINMRRK